MATDLQVALQHYEFKYQTEIKIASKINFKCEI